MTLISKTFFPLPQDDPTSRFQRVGQARGSRREAFPTEKGKIKRHHVRRSAGKHEDHVLVLNTWFIVNHVVSF